MQPMTLIPVPSPRVGSEKASQRTKHRRTASMQLVREFISGGSSTTQFVDETRSRSTSERDAILEQLQGGMKVMIPPSESLAMKADLTLPWSKLRIIRRYISIAHYILSLHAHVLHVAGGLRYGEYRWRQRAR